MYPQVPRRFSYLGLVPKVLNPSFVGNFIANFVETGTAQNLADACSDNQNMSALFGMGVPPEGTGR